MYQIYLLITFNCIDHFVLFSLNVEQKLLTDLNKFAAQVVTSV